MKDLARLVVLFDLKTAGHHMYYASHLVRQLGAGGYRVTFVTPNETREIKQLPHGQPNLTIAYTGVNYDDTATGSIITKYFRVARSHLQAARSLWKCFRLAREQHACIVQLLYLNGLELPLYLWQLWRHRSPWRLFGIVVKPVYAGPAGRIGALAQLYRYLTTKAVKRMLEKGTLEGIFVHTDAIRDALIRRFGWRDRYAERIIVTPDPVDLPGERVTKDEARKRLGLPTGVPVLLFFGIMLKNKGIDILMEAVGQVKQDLRLVIAGRPEFYTANDIEEYRSAFKDPARVITRLEHIPDDEMSLYFYATDAVILPYRGSTEGTSGVLQLAAAAGKPVIVTDTGELGNIVRRDSLGIVVAPDSSQALRAGIEEFLDRLQAISGEVASHALEYAERSGWKKFAGTIEAAYRTKQPEPCIQNPDIIAN
jgi:glycosyltransferase involved in cell wall biosynthesis